MLAPILPLSSRLPNIYTPNRHPSLLTNSLQPGSALSLPSSSVAAMRTSNSRVAHRPVPYTTPPITAFNGPPAAAGSVNAARMASARRNLPQHSRSNAEALLAAANTPVDPVESPSAPALGALLAAPAHSTATPALPSSLTSATDILISLLLFPPVRYTISHRRFPLILLCRRPVLTTAPLGSGDGHLLPSPQAKRGGQRFVIPSRRVVAYLWLLFPGIKVRIPLSSTPSTPASLFSASPGGIPSHSPTLHTRTVPMFFCARPLAPIATRPSVLSSCLTTPHCPFLIRHLSASSSGSRRSQVHTPVAAFMVSQCFSLARFSSLSHRASRLMPS